MLTEGVVQRQSGHEDQWIELQVNKRSFISFIKKCFWLFRHTELKQIRLSVVMALKRKENILAQRRKGAKKPFGNAVALCAFAREIFLQR